MSVKPEPSVASAGYLFKNSFHNVLSTGVQLGGRSLVGLIIPLMMTPQDYGEYAYLAWITMTIIQVSTLGLPQAAQRYVALAAEREKKAAIARGLKMVGMATTVGTITLLTIWQFGIHPTWPYGVPVFCLVVLAAVFGVYGAIQAAVFKGCYDFASPVVAEVPAQAARLALLLVLFLLMRVKVAILTVFAVEAVYWGCQAAGLWLRQHDTRGSVHWHVHWHGVGGREILLYAATVGTLVLVDVVVWQRVEVAFLEGFGFVKEAGFFNLAAQISTLLTAVPGVAVAALFPSFSALQGNDPERLRRIYQMATIFLYVTAVPLLALGLFVVPAILPLVYGHRYRPVLHVLPFVLIGRTVALVGGAASTWLYATGNQRPLLKVVPIGAAASLLLNSAFIPSLGLTGAGISVLTVQSLVAIFTMVLAGRSMRCEFPLSWMTIGTGVASVLVGCSLAHFVGPWLGLTTLMILFGLGCARDSAVKTASIDTWKRLENLIAA